MKLSQKQIEILKKYGVSDAVLTEAQETKGRISTGIARVLADSLEVVKGPKHNYKRLDVKKGIKFTGAKKETVLRVIHLMSSQNLSYLCYNAKEDVFNPQVLVAIQEFRKQVDSACDAITASKGKAKTTK